MILEDENGKPMWLYTFFHGGWAIVLPFVVLAWAIYEITHPKADKK